ncbi:hypothetical protein [Aquitalea sp.]|uniref:hypothetical protein n=1 Tax=Aquitalea sp. TaxID=1872623 RepID=UPI00258F7A6C|nr:hypothetical protein [Aquitalea sp.]
MNEESIKFRERFLNKFTSLLSGNKKKLAEKLSKDIGTIAAVALVGNQNNSRMEVEVIAAIIKHLKPLDIHSFTVNPNKAILVGRTPQGNIVHIHPQYRVAKPKRILAEGKQDYWYVDMAIKIYSSIDENTCIGLWGVEYDGHPQHFIETGVIKSHFRDVVIENETEMRPIHITKEGWSNYPDEYIRHMMNYFYRRVRDTEHMSLEDLRNTYWNVFETADFEVIGEGKIKRAVPWESIEISK